MKLIYFPVTLLIVEFKVVPKTDPNFHHDTRSFYLDGSEGILLGNKTVRIFSHYHIQITV